jgi:cation transport protein ChaC
MWSIHHRGSEEEPGLVLALDESDVGICEGIAFRVSAAKAGETLVNLRKRELISSAYYEKICPVVLHDGQVVQAVCYIIDRDHVQYCGDLALETQAQVIAKATGGRGTNSEYLLNTSAYMVESGIDDHDIMWLVSRVNELSSS